MTSVSVSVTNYVTLGGEFALQVEIVFDDAVVNHDDAARAIPMRMGVFFRRPSVRGPARVANAIGAVERMLRAAPLQGSCSLPGARRTSSVDAGGIAYGDARRVIAAVFQSPQPINDDRNYLFRTNITDDSAHALILSDAAGCRVQSDSIPPGAATPQCGT